MHPDDFEAVAEERVEDLVLRLNAICKTATLNFALSVGGLIVQSLYSGDLDRWRSRNPKKDRSLRKLARHPNLPMSPEALYRSVAIFEICQRLGISSWQHISTTHVRMVLPLLPDQQANLLEAAEKNKWSARRLDEEVASLRQRDPSTCTNRGGQRRPSRLRIAIRRVEQVITIVDAILGPDQEASTEPSPESVRTAIEVMQLAAERCAALEGRLERHVLDPSTSSSPAMAGTPDAVK
jgi:hypothetical protein